MSPSRGYPPASLAWLIWALGAALYLIAFYQRVAPAVLTQELQLISCEHGWDTPPEIN